MTASERTEHGCGVKITGTGATSYVETYETQAEAEEVASRKPLRAGDVEITYGPLYQRIVVTSAWSVVAAPKAAS